MMLALRMKFGLYYKRKVNSMKLKTELKESTDRA